MKNNNQDVKEMVQQKYSEIANQSKVQNETSCCGAGSCGTYTIMSEDYSGLDGYNPDADLGLGCGLPTEYAKIKKGDTVVDLGSGAGNDAFVARTLTGEEGEVIGIDMTEAMIQKAKGNTEKLGFTNVAFRLGDIEDIPLSSKRADVVVSNCVMNLVPDKAKAFSEVFRILKPLGHFSISDIVLKGDLPDAIKKEGEMYAGCVSGAIKKSEYLGILAEQGFVNITVQKEKEIIIPVEVLSQYLSQEEINSYKEKGMGIYSITVYAERPDASCGCDPRATCC
ncbi:arsenite methyltransferase [Cytophaga hutchinsonii]|jgi:arsenite methyltransferase|uniref:Arsenite methyltransferase n=1 Tax=Cytophaga hutchinsonii (strain ATCC 33406 / DSM 1761 / CIP 103989 / NBRC 15051 / NCIMB 9469 / D465) TaxID=269798 RepID=A0A6N4SQZ3_CYTH3|nr:arsenite methyltransferase [Cytophaga hutchinsonii]ABG58785.1 SAM-dependent methyltransferase [Cytophaga hutchinsonii ATCC 33406]SFX61779.1 Methyltransferase domain-containing protein [Cytophaga hutchinsonii ATCC 33406]